MVKRRRLEDLYVVGKEVVFDDGTGDPITVWVQKLNSVDHDVAMRKANAERARVLSARRDLESLEYQSARSDVLDMSQEELIEYLVDNEIAPKRAAFEAEVAAEEEWTEDDYLQGLQDAFNALSEDTDKDDPEVQRLTAEVKRFADAVMERLKGETDRARKDFEKLSYSELEDQVTDLILKTRADLAWLSEFRKCEIWRSARDAAHHQQLYFRDRKEIDMLAQQVLVRLVEAYGEISVDVTEGKDSEETPASSTSSEPSGAGAMAEPSGPKDAAA